MTLTYADGTTKSVNACLTPVGSVHLAHVTTVEGIGSSSAPHPVQAALALAHGSQCGFCTPGIVMSMYALLAKNPNPTEEEVEHAFDGNLCRCTGYRPILQGFRDLVRNGPDAASTTPVYSVPDEMAHLVEEDVAQGGVLYFPPVAGDPTSVTSWYTPRNLEQVLDLKARFPAARLVIGNTELGVEAKLKHAEFGTIVATGAIPELLDLDVVDNVLRIGASVTLTALQAFCEAPEEGNEVYDGILQALRWFAGGQIRNVASLAGNVMTGSPISDLNPLWMACGASIVVTSSARGERVIPFSELYTGYRRNSVAEDEVMVRLEVALAEPHEYVRSFKQARRREDDIAIVGASFRAKLDPETGALVSAGIGYGGMAAWTASAPQTVAVLTAGSPLSHALVQQAMATVDQDVPLGDNAPGGQVPFRRALARSFVYKFFLYIASKADSLSGSLLAADEVSGAQIQKHGPLSQGRQEYTSSAFTATVQDSVLSKDSAGDGGVHMPATHASAFLQAAGEAVYVDDIPISGSTLHAAPLLSQVAVGDIESIDSSAAEALHPSIRVFTASDIPEGGENKQGAIVADEEVIVSSEIRSQGQLLGVVVAATPEMARKAARAVVVNLVAGTGVPDVEAVVTIDDAIGAGSYMAGGNGLTSGGDVEQALDAAPHVLEGEMYVGGQEHFYLETFATLAEPVEGNQLRVWSSTQNPSKTQKFVSRLLGVPQAKIAVHVKRVGGGFGGKETRTCPLSAAVALAASKCGAPVTMMLDRDEDMMYSGTRHPYKGVYRVGYDDDGKFLALDLQMYSNAGYSLDLSGSVMDRALFHCTSAFKVPVVRAKGFLCKTNTPSNTAFRGFGAPQTMMIAESWVDNVARSLGKDPVEIRSLNLFGVSDAERSNYTHYGQELNDVQRLDAVWSQVLSSSQYEERKAEVAKYNAEHKWRKRGLAAIPTSFGMSFTALFLNQAGALVHVYQDGTVLVSMGGIEMGQGLFTKMAQVAATAFQIPVSDVFVDETATDKVANTVPTAASVSSDINGYAVLNACEKIIKRFDDMGLDSDMPLADKALAAHLARVNLSANGFYATPIPGHSFDPSGNSEGEGEPFNYFCYGASVAEVEVDVLTGDHVVTRADLVMDVGDSLNPAIDLGQVEGAFVQGMGLFTMEELIKMPKTGHIFTRGPSFYKIPGFGDIPSVFNVSLLPDAPNPRAIHSSKGVGEPPLFLAASVFYAIKDALAAQRAQAGEEGPFELMSPASSERIRMAVVAPEIDQQQE